MSQTVNLVVANNVGCGMPEGNCFPCSRVYRRTTAVYSCPSIGRHRIRSYVKIGGLKSGSLAASFVCEARRNPDFSRPNYKFVPSRDRNRNNDGRDIFENFEEDMLSSKNGHWVSPSSGKSQATSSPGPREKEIVELFKKVQARLRERVAERATFKEEKKVEAPRGQAKDKSAVDSLLNLLKKHSPKQVWRSSGEESGKDHDSDQLEESNQYDGVQSTDSFDSNVSPKDGVQSTDSFDSNVSPKDESRDANIASVARPRSVFRRKSPISRIRYQPVSYNEDETNVEPIVSEDNVNNRHQIDLKPEDKPESEPEPEPESEIDLDAKGELFFPEQSEDDSHDAEQTYNDSHDAEQTYNNESVEEQLDAQSEDLSALNLSQLKALAKHRGVKGYSKMKKVDLVELLTES